MRRSISFLLFYLFAVTIGTSYAHEGHQPLPTKGLQFDLKAGHITLSRAAREALDVQSVEVQRQEVAEQVKAYATVVAPWTRHAFVTSRLPGRVVTIHVRPGDFVEAGQVLAEIESVDLLTLRLDYQKVQNELSLSAKVLESVAPAAEAGSVSGQRLLEAETTHRQNQNALDVLRAKAAGLGVREDKLSAEGDDDSSPLRLPLTSPIGGVIVHADLAIGKVVEPTEHLLEIVDTSRVWVKIGVLEQDLHRAQQGDAVRLSFSGLPDRPFETTVTKIDLLLQPQTHQGTVWAEIENPVDGPRLLPGMNGQAALHRAGQKAALSVPSQAVFSDGAERYVLVEEAATKEGSEYQKVAVVTGRKFRDRVGILAGKVLPGDRVVTRGGHELSTLFFQGVLRVSSETARSIGLKVETVSKHPVERILQIDGAVDVPPQRRTFASSQLAGTIRDIRVDRGQTVKVGDVLAEIASLESQDLQLNLLQAHLDSQMWRDTLASRRAAGVAIPRRTLLETESRLAAFQAQVASLRQKLLVLGLTAEQIDGVVNSGTVLDTIPVRAPIAGAVVHFDRVLGQIVRADEPLFEIHDLSQSWVQAFVGERESTQVQIGQTARVRFVARPDSWRKGTVARIGPVVGADTRAQAVWIEFREPPPFALQHRMLARVTLTMEQSPPVLAVPLGSVVREGLRSFVFVQKADGTFDRRQVTLGRSDDRYFEINAELKEGESVVTHGVSELQTAFASVR